MNSKYITYDFQPGRRSILAEVYFPKRLETQGRIYKALEEGLDINIVRKYLREHASGIREEMSVYPHWFDPTRYEPGSYEPKVVTASMARKRMRMCSQVFYGWSVYEVDGVFGAEYVKGKPKRIDSERTQVVRLMFKFEEDKLENEARNIGFPEVYRAVLYWVLSEYGHTDNFRMWDKTEQDRFITRHATWDKEKVEFAKELFPQLTPIVAKWIVDCGLFIFGYLVRQFWIETALHFENKNRKVEDTIWVTSIFHMNINTLDVRKE